MALPELEPGRRSLPRATAVPRRALAASNWALGGRSPRQPQKLRLCGKVDSDGGARDGGSEVPDVGPGRVETEGWKGGVPPESAKAANGLMSGFAETWAPDRDGVCPANPAQKKLFLWGQTV